MHIPGWRPLSDNLKIGINIIGDGISKICFFYFLIMDRFVNIK